MREFGRITHDGHSYVAQGALVEGRRVVGYLQGSALRDWHGRTLMECRMATLEEWRSPNDFGDPRYVIAWRLTHGRAIVGLSMGDGMLFRGELVDGIEDDNDLRREAIAEAEYWQRIDAEDWERQEAELLDVA